MEWKDWMPWLLAPGGGIALLVTYLLRGRLAKRVEGSWLVRRINVEKNLLSCQGQIETLKEELYANRESFRRRAEDLILEMATKDQQIGYLTASLEQLMKQANRVDRALEEGRIQVTYGASPTTPSSSPGDLLRSPTAPVEQTRSRT